MIFLRKCIALLLQEDLYYPHPLVQDILWTSLHKAVEPVLMHWPGKKLREKALKTAIEHIHYEDENTRYICIGPVNKVCNQAFHLHTNLCNNVSSVKGSGRNLLSLATYTILEDWMRRKQENSCRHGKGGKEKDVRIS